MRKRSRNRPRRWRKVRVDEVWVVEPFSALVIPSRFVAVVAFIQTYIPRNALPSQNQPPMKLKDKRVRHWLQAAELLTTDWVREVRGT